MPTIGPHSRVEDLTFALDKPRAGIVVVLHDEVQVREALQVVQAEQDPVVIIVWLTSAQGTPEFQETLATCGLFHKWCKVPGAQSGRVSFKVEQVTMFIVKGCSLAPWLG